jgi:putative DNA primase/helicase
MTLDVAPQTLADSLHNVRRFLSLLHGEDETVEIRVPKYGRFRLTAAGYFDDLDKAADAAIRWDGRANLYVTLNPVDPALLARSVNRMLDRADATTADTDVLRRRRLFIDIDPVRPSGISSTDEELASALTLGERVRAYLNSLAWPAPLVAMSGNGCYLIFGIDLANDAESNQLVSGVLKALAERFNTEAAHVDTTVANASRIIGVVGTTKRKGDATTERPHRRSYLIDAPDGLGIVPRELLEALVSAKSAIVVEPTSGGGRLDEMLRRAGVEYREQPPDANGVTWYHLEQCPLHDGGEPFECGVGQLLPDGHYAGHCFHARGAGKGWQDFKRALGLDVATRHDSAMVGVAGADNAPRRFARTDAGNAELFASQYADRLRYDHRRGRWLIWSGHRWVDDADAEVVRLAIVAARHRGLSAVSLTDFEERKAETRFAIASENGARIEAMLKIAKAQPSLADKGDQWDAGPWLLGVANGLVDLRTGELRPGDRDDRITMHTDIEFDAGATAPRWEQFLREVFNDDAEMIAFIQQAIGYSLTGDTREQCMFLCHGTGANGKSVFLAILKRLAGRYAFNAPFSSFERQHQSSIPNDLAALVGRRLVTSSETNEGTRLNEARMKALTGCDPITARFLHAEFFTFTPVAKYWLAVNHKPVVGDDSVGFWRRVRLIPFTRQFRGAAADKTLQGALEAELPGILAWGGARYGVLARPRSRHTRRRA